MSVRVVRALVFVGVGSACGGRTPESSVPVAAQASASAGGGASAAGAVQSASPAASELPLVPARLQLLVDAPIARQAYWRQPVVRVEGNATGYIDAAGSRVIASLSEMRTIAGPQLLKKVCVAHDGKTTFAISEEGGDPRLWRADRFDGALALVGTRAMEVSGLGDAEPLEWLVQSAEGTVVVDCDAGTVVRIGAPASRLFFGYWGRTIQLMHTGNSQPVARCFLRTAAQPAFRETRGCAHSFRSDGLMQLEMPKQKGREKLPAKCLFLLDSSGKELPCTTALGPRRSPPTNPLVERPNLANARYYAPERAVVSGPLGLFRLELALEPSARLGPESLGACTALLPEAPVFACDGDPNSDVVVSVDRLGSIREELRRPHLPGQGVGQVQQTRFDVSDDGGIAAGGDCEGNLSNAACVRERRGVWRTVQFSKALIKALERTAPATRLIPTPDGDLYVGTGTLEGPRRGAFGLPSELRLLLFRASEGEPTQISKLPLWIVEALSKLVSPGMGSGNHLGVSVSVSGARRVRVWPLERSHPAFGTPENCRVDIALDAQFDTDCTQGRLYSSGRVGLLQKKPDELYETLDAGGNWARLALPKGFLSEEIACTAVGCRIGPFWRAGWGGR